MKLIPTLLCAFALMGLTGVALAEPKDGVNFRTLPVAQATESGKKVEVTEFFAYYCPHCHVFEPALAAWVKKQGDNIVFKRVHFPGGSANDPEAHLYLTLEAMGKLGEYHSRVFRAWHVEHLRLIDEAAIFDWIAKNGIDKAQFAEAWNSFGVVTKLKRVGPTIASYEISNAPTVVVDGRYVTSPSTASAADPKASVTEKQLSVMTTQVLDALVAKVMKDSAAKPATPGTPAVPAKPATPAASVKPTHPAKAAEK